MLNKEYYTKSQLNKKLMGRWGEERAAEYLKNKGYKIIGLNFSCRFGEIDIIASYGVYVVFAEVKLRKDASFARAAESVNRAKRRRLTAAAEIWLSKNRSMLQPRFDVLEVYAPDGRGVYTLDGSAGSPIEINHIENAFSREDL
ncbi:MAG: YraN family protein [Oscillospiraceae bacterium]|nr:YraN family protein [Oscillospiraceae bacterium]